MTKSISEWQKEVHETARSKGWHPVWPFEDDRINAQLVSSWIALVHSELSEALEELRTAKDPVDLDGRIDPDTGKPEGFVTELADAMIRIMDMCGALGLNIEQAIREKHAFNQTRPIRHGGKAV